MKTIETITEATIVKYALEACQWSPWAIVVIGVIFCCRSHLEIWSKGVFFLLVSLVVKNSKLDWNRFMELSFASTKVDLPKDKKASKAKLPHKLPHNIDKNSDT